MKHKWVAVYHSHMTAVYCGGLLLQEHATLVDSGIVSALCYVDIVDTYDGVSTNCAAEVVTCCNVAGKF